MLTAQTTGTPEAAVARRRDTAASQRAPRRHAPRPSGVPVLRRACSCGGTPGPDGECAECKRKRLMRHATGEAAAGESIAPASVHTVLASHGAPLEHGVRRQAERRLGHDLRSVRIHRDARAAASARAVSADAYTVGEQIVFGAGRYTPGTAAGDRLLLHELAHVLQARRAPVSGGGPLVVGSPTAAEEHAADRVARAHAPVVAPAAPTRRLRRFGSGEHVEIGNRAAPGQTVRIFGYPTPIPLGEMIAMAGDYFGSLDEMQSVAHSGPAGVAEIDCARHKVQGTPCTDPAAEAAVTARYERLAATNWTHFSTGGPAGQNNRDLYIDYHTRAIRGAYLAGSLPLYVQPYFPEALEGFGMHYLTDAFSAGHIRTPRAQLRSHWNGLYPSFSDNLIKTIACYMASYLRDAEHRWTPVGVLAYFLEDKIRARAGSRLGNFGLGDVISIAMHDADNAGLDVVSAAGPPGTTTPGPYHWRAIGDNFLFPGATPPATLTGVTPAPPGPTQTMVVEAARRSWAEVAAARSAGSAHSGMPSTNPSAYTALSLVPQADPASTANPAYGWNVPDIYSVPPLTRTIINAEFTPGQQLYNQLSTFSIPNCESGYHAGSAWRCFMRVLLANPFWMLERVAVGNTCPPGNNNPCTNPAEPLVPAGSC